MKDFVLYREFETLPAASPLSTTLQLAALDSGPLIRFEQYGSEASARAAGDGEVYKRLFEVKGPWTERPTHAVFAIWLVADPAQVEGFLESRRQLFAVRQQVLPRFAYDWVLQSLDNTGNFMVLGLYGDEESATSLCRDHPEIQKFAKAHPAAQYGARDLTGLRAYRVDV